MQLPTVLWLLIAVSTSTIAILENLTLPLFQIPMNHTLTAPGSTSIDDWANAARQNIYRQSQEQQTVITVLKYLFEGKQSPQQATTIISQTYNALIRQGNTASVFELWLMICEASQMLGSNQNIDGQIIQLLNQLSSLPDVTDSQGRPIGPGAGFSGVYWRDLPAFRIMFREYAMGEICYCPFSMTEFADTNQISSQGSQKRQMKATGPMLNAKLY